MRHVWWNKYRGYTMDYCYRCGESRKKIRRLKRVEGITTPCGPFSR